ncbi:MAG: hypothetical protein WBO36_06515 [Saprospiraceae bacterium]
MRRHKIAGLFVILMMSMLRLSGQYDTIEMVDSIYAEEELYEDDPYFWSNTKEVALNFTPLVSKLVPFNLGQNEAGNVGLIYRRYYSKRAFRVSFGANLNESSFDLGQFIYLGIGIERRRPIAKNKKWTYTSGWELFINPASDPEGSSIGIRKLYGLEYHASKRIFISTEASLLFGILIDGEGPLIRFDPPVAIFVNVRLY